ncbi:MAG: O-antigen ligase family protein [Flavobacteriales bacterium]|nr:O-antigen ligase family protein [Flavobacteriales bacterium]
MTALLRTYGIAAACVLFIVMNTVLTAREVYWLNLLPMALIMVWAMVGSVDRLLLFIVFATPLSINLEEMELGGIGVAVPTEPLMVALTLLYLVKVALERGVVRDSVLRHPVTAVLIAQLVWMAACIVPSSMPLVSAKYLAARLWFVCTMYFMATRLFEEPRNMHRFFWAYVAGMAIVVVYTVTRHAGFHFAHDPAHWVMEPFFKDHTSYGACLAFFLPFTLTAMGVRSYTRTQRLLAVLLFLILLTGLVFSYTRAAWLSLAGALGLFLAMKMRLPAWTLGVVLLVGGVGYWVNKDRITIALERNRKESSDDFAEHVQSISNISTDASNLERINRWNSALRMFAERPVFGWGPGTYMFQYAPFQASEDRTIISTNFGRQGNAHSEYLGPLAEQGIPGIALMVVLVVVTSVRAMRLHERLPAGGEKRLVAAAFLGLVTYYLHGSLNNFLDLDKASVPFWGFTAMIVVLDVKHAVRKDALSADSR